MAGWGPADSGAGEVGIAVLGDARLGLLLAGDVGGLITTVEGRGWGLGVRPGGAGLTGLPVKMSGLPSPGSQVGPDLVTGSALKGMLWTPPGSQGEGIQHGLGVQLRRGESELRREKEGGAVPGQPRGDSAPRHLGVP